MKDLATLTVLIDSFAKLPGVGVKTAERMAYAVLEMDEEISTNKFLQLGTRCPICLPDPIQMLLKKEQNVVVLSKFIPLKRMLKKEILI